MNYQLKNEGGIYVLQRGGIDLRCPFQTRVPIPQHDSGLMAGTAGQIRIALHEGSCSSSCALFKIKVWSTKVENGALTIQQRCSGDHGIEGIDFTCLPADGKLIESSQP